MPAIGDENYKRRCPTMVKASRGLLANLRIEGVCYTYSGDIVQRIHANVTMRGFHNVCK